MGVGRTVRPIDMVFAPVQKAKANTPVPGIMDSKYQDHTLGRGELNSMLNIFISKLSITMLCKNIF